MHRRRFCRPFCAICDKTEEKDGIDHMPGMRETVFGHGSGLPELRMAPRHFRGVILATAGIALLRIY